jgi:hypothetical protein
VLFVGYYTNGNHSEAMNRYIKISTVARQFDTALCHFNNARLAAINQHLTGNTKFDDIVKLNQKANEILGSIEFDTNPRSIEYTNLQSIEHKFGTVRHCVDAFEQLYRDQSEIEQEMHSILTKRTKLHETILKQINDLNHQLEKQDNQMVRYSSDEIHRLQYLSDQLLLIKTEKEKEKNIQESITDLSDVIVEKNNIISKNVVTQEAKDSLDKLKSTCEEYINIVHKLRSFYNHQNVIQAQLIHHADEFDLLSNEIRENLSNILVENEFSYNRLTKESFSLINMTFLIIMQICVVIAFIVSVIRQKIIHIAASNNIDPYSPRTLPESGEPKNLQAVADKLQEVVDLLRNN